MATNPAIITDVDTAISEFGGTTELAYDLETNSLSPWIGSIAVVTISDGPERAAVLHVRGNVPERLWRFLESRRLLVGHNVVNFDTVWSAVHGMRVGTTRWYDTMVAEQAILPAGRQDFRANLATTLERRFRDNKDARKRDMGVHTWMTQELTEQQVEYAAHDVLHLLELRRRQLERAAGTPLEKAIEVEMSILPAVSAMKRNGLPISLPAVQEMVEQKRELAEVYEVLIQGELGQVINLNSAAQLKAACHKVGLMVPDTTWETFRSLELGMVGGAADSLASRIIQWKSNAQILKMYRQEWLDKHVQEDGRVHASFWQLGTDTGRFSSSEPNLQQVPKKARGVYQAPEGELIVACDYSQIEVRIAAAQAHDEVMLKGMEHDDVHTAVAAQMFGVTVGAVTKEQRSLAKACVFTLLFAGSADRLYEYTRLNGGNLQYDEAQRLFTKFFLTYRGLQNARDQAKYASRRNALPIRLPTGIQRVLTAGNTLTPQTVLNTTVQGTAAAGLKYALRTCIERGLHEYLCATVHDELVACVPAADAADYGRELERAMLDGMREVTDAPLRAEVKIGRAWS